MSETLQYEITLPSHGVRENKNYPVVIALHRATDSIEKVAVSYFESKKPQWSKESH